MLGGTDYIDYISRNVDRFGSKGVDVVGVIEELWKRLRCGV